jgi:hypothetical protein
VIYAFYEADRAMAAKFRPEFLKGDKVAPTFRALSKGGVAKIAVAFWGNGAIKSLGLKNPSQQFHIVCNLNCSRGNFKGWQEKAPRRQ